ncbi:MAG: lamin tail domain-containing protein [Saprospiraceae bacterium]|nr:lamin tail domain-containing protein [Saprospiraceae bacterium]
MKLQNALSSALVATFFLFAFGKMAAQSSVVINEVMASNQTYITDENGEYEDWIELYNGSSSAINLSGWHITDNPDNLEKWDFPTNTSIPAMGYIIIWADEDSSQGPLHANFKLSAVGEQLLLVNASGNTVQDISFGQQQADKGYARSPNGTGSFTIKNPTFKANNDTGISAVNDKEAENSLLISPNPATGDEVVLRSKNTENQLFVIYDQMGHQKHQASFFNQTTVDISTWPTGIYYVRTSKNQTQLLEVVR